MERRRRLRERGRETGTGEIPRAAGETGGSLVKVGDQPGVLLPLPLLFLSQLSLYSCLPEERGGRRAISVQEIISSETALSSDRPSGALTAMGKGTWQQLAESLRVVQLGAGSPQVEEKEEGRRSCVLLVRRQPQQGEQGLEIVR